MVVRDPTRRLDRRPVGCSLGGQPEYQLGPAGLRFRCRGRPRAADDAPAHLAESFWEDGWSGYFETPREQEE